MAKRSLVLQLARMGDMVQTLPLLRRLRALEPEGHLTLLTDRPGPEVLTGFEAADEIITLDLRKLREQLPKRGRTALASLAEQVRELRQGQYDRVVNINFSRLSLLLTYLLQPTEVLGYRPTADGRQCQRDAWLALVHGLVHNRRVNRINLGDVFRWAAPGPGAREAGEALPRPPRAAGRGVEPVVALQMGSQHGRRQWPQEAYARLAAGLVEQCGARLWLLGTKEEAHLGRQLLGRLKAGQRERVENLQGQTSLAELKERLRASDILVTGDTGTMHLGAALGTQVMALFLGPAAGWETGPYAPGHFLIQAEPECHPCLEAVAQCEEWNCGAMIPPEMPLRLAKSVLTGTPLPGWNGRRFPGVQVYKSGWDDLGLVWEPRIDRPQRFVDVVGTAYREAAKGLVGLKAEAAHVAGGYREVAGRRGVRLREQMRGFLEALEGQAWPQDMEVQGALLPVRAFEREREGRGQPNGVVREVLAACCRSWLGKEEGKAGVMARMPGQDPDHGAEGIGHESL